MTLLQATARARALAPSNGYALAIHIAANESGYSTGKISAELRKGRKRKKYDCKPAPGVQQWEPYAD